MSELVFVLGIPLLGAAALAWRGSVYRAPEMNAILCGLTFLGACALTLRVMSQGPRLAFHEQFFVDAFNVFLVTLTAFVAFTTAIFSRPYMRIEADRGKVGPVALRLYHSVYQLFIFTMLVALTTNHLGILWVALEAATLATVLLVSLYRTPASVEAAWKYFILCGVGIAQALFGTILLYLAAVKATGAGGDALLWTHLD
ncbi:MAG: hydrogenase 4 subunit F, partial [Betaproteobacteria bacterium]|nr:hydrogenase 4 subunit F [Betaproteobacteria bacterium]